MRARIIYADGRDRSVKPAGDTFTLKELQTIVGGTICIHRLGASKLVPVCNDNGKLIGLPVNTTASRLWQQSYPIEKFPINNDGLIVGDVLVCDPDLVR